MMAIDRRHFMQASLALGCLPWVRAEAQPPTLLTAAWDEQQQWLVGRVGPPSPTIELPARAHQLLAVPGQPDQAIVVARRPGSYLARIDWRRARLLQLFELEEARKLVGHALFSPDGKRLITAEMDEASGQGRLALRDPISFKRLDDWPSHGIGPHEIIWLDQHTLAVANGGILTLPETGRYKRNLTQMDPSLALLNARDGGLRHAYRLDNPQLSIRHLALCRDGSLACALQNEGKTDSPLLAILRDGQFAYAPTPAPLAKAMAGYAASIVASENRLLMSCPSGNLLTEWDSHGQPIAQRELPRVFGVAASQGYWLASGEGGQLWRLQPGSLEILQTRLSNLHWDNHLTVV